MLLMFIRPSDSVSGTGFLVESDFVPRINEQVYIEGKGYSVSMVKYFITWKEIPEYKKIKKPFVRMMLMNL